MSVPQNIAPLDDPPPDEPLFPIRHMRFDFDKEEIPRWWFYNSLFLTHVLNGMNLVFPAGERFFVRSVRHYLDRIDDPALKERVRRFVGQEIQHGQEHESAFELLEAQGYEIRSYLQRYEKIAYDWGERFSLPIMRLSTTVALEHFTATMAERAFTEPFLSNAHPRMQELLRWHAAEEIEHRSVAFDVFQRMGGGYFVRALGAFSALFSLLIFWGMGTRHLIRQEPTATRALIRKERAAARNLGMNRRYLIAGILRYLHPGFHPDQVDSTPIAHAYLKKIGRLEG